jgi:hypothetical protein
VRQALVDQGEYRIGIGAVTLGLRLVPRPYDTLLPLYFGMPGVPGAPDIRLTVHVTEDKVKAPIPNSLYYDKEITTSGFTLAGRLVHGRHLPDEAGVELRVPRRLLCGHTIRIFEQLLHQAFHSAARARREDCFLIHSSGVVRNGAGFLFVGASGSGKTTIARLSTGEQILNDEICLVALADNPTYLYSTPFNGFFIDKVEGRAPLKAVFLLVQREAHRVLPVTESEAIAAIFQQVVPPVTLDESVGKGTYERMLGMVGRLLAHVPTYRLEFRQDGEFWHHIDQIMQKGELP